MDTEFNLQTFLSDMDKRHSDAHHETNTKLDTLIVASNALTLRVVQLEQTDRVAKWIGASILLAAFAAIADVVKGFFRG